MSDGTVSVTFTKHQGSGSCQLQCMGMEVNDPEAAANAFPNHKALSDGKFEVQDIDGNKLQLAKHWLV